MGLRLTVDGAWYGLVVLGFTAAALNTGANLLLALAGGVLGVIAANAFLARRAVRRLEVELSGPSQVPQGSRLRLTLRMQGRGGRGVSLPFAVSSPWCSDPQGVLGVSAGGQVSLPLRPDADLARGRHVLGALRIASAAPFGLAQAQRVSGASHELLVTPPVFALRSGALDCSVRGEGNAVAAWLQGAQQRDRVRSLREFRPGDSPRAIHWRSSARRGSLVVREFERGVPERACVIVYLSRGAPELVDAALSLAASLHAGLRARGERVALAVVGQRTVWLPPEAAQSRVLEALALAEPSAGAGAAELSAVVRRVAGELPPRAWLIALDREARVAGATRWLLHDPGDVDRWLIRRSSPRRELVAEAAR